MTAQVKEKEIVDATYAELVDNLIDSGGAKSEKQTAVAVIEPLRPMTIIGQAVTQGASVEVLDKLMTLQERWDANEARKAFFKAIARTRKRLPVIQKKKHVYFESKRAEGTTTDYWYEDLAEIARTIDPILGEEGLNYVFKTQSEPGKPVIVTCILMHDDGHFMENTLSAPPDDTGNKNAVQKIGSTVTYLQRYTLKAALGLAASRDDDGRGGPDQKPEKQSAPSAKAETAVDRKTTAPTEPHLIPSKGRSAAQWAEEYKQAIRRARNPKELAEWAAKNAKSLSVLADPPDDTPEDDRRAYMDIAREIDDLFQVLLDRPQDQATPRRAPSAKAAETAEAADWHREMIGALSGFTTDAEVKFFEEKIAGEKAKVSQQDWDAVQVEIEQTRRRIALEG